MSAATLEQVITEAMRTARAGERIITAMEQLEQLLESAKVVRALAPSGANDCTSAIEHIRDGALALARAQKTIQANLDKLMET